MKTSIFDYSIVQPFSFLGLTDPFWNVHLDTIVQTWIMMGVLLCLALLIRFSLKSEHAVLIKEAIALSFSFFIDLIEETCGSFKPDIFYFVMTVFLFVVGAGITGLLPYVGESTQDINTTFALGISCFCFSQYQGIKAHGIYHFKEYFEPFFLLFPLNVVGECAKAASMSFRLFGNILGGSIMVDLILHALETIKEPYLIATAILIVFSILLYKSPLSRFLQKSWLIKMHTYFLYFVIAVPTIQLFFGAIESLVQAFVLTTLTITYSSMAIGASEETEEVAVQPTDL